MSRKNGGIIGPANTPVGGLFKGVAGGVWRMNDVANFVSNSQWPSGPQSIDNSCRFDDGSTDNLSKTFSASNRRTFTFSTWIKRGDQSANQSLFSARTDSSNYATIRIESNGKFHIFDIATSFQYQIKTNRVLRDNSAWYHLVVAFDSTQATASNRIKMYVNGQQETSLAESSYPSENYQSFFNNNLTHYVGLGGNAGDAYDGYMAEVVFIDGQALDPTSFGEFDTTTGIWKPKKIGAFASAGTNSFYLDFKDSSNVGKDASGLSNNFTVNNLTSIDQSTDTCVENFCTLNPLVTTSNATFSEGNLKLVGSSSSAFNNRSQGTFGVQSGKWYFEIEFDSISATSPTIGIGRIDRSASDNPTGSNAGDVCIRADNEKYDEGSSSASYFSSSISAGNIIGVALDMDNGKVWFSRNGTFVGTVGSSGQAATFTVGNGVTITPTVRPIDGTLICNFGNSPVAISSGNADANGFGNFEYAVPSGYYALNTSNLNTYG